MKKIIAGLLLGLLVIVGLVWLVQPIKTTPASTIRETPPVEPTLRPESQKSEAQEKTQWFTPQRWLTDQEIDWALGLVYHQQFNQTSFKILPAYQFHYVLETKGQELGFPELLDQLNETVELVFIPVNNPDFHWSLLVYETKHKRFYHYDTLRGANDAYIKPLVKDLLIQLRQENNPNLKQLLKTNYAIQQGNGCDCGTAVIEITQRIMEKWGTFQKNSPWNLSKDLGGFDFPAARKEWREKWTNLGNE